MANAALSALDGRERDIVLCAARALLDRRDWVDDWDVHTLTGAFRPELRAAIAEWPDVPPGLTRAISNCLFVICAVIRLPQEDWDANFDFPKKEAFRVHLRLNDACRHAKRTQ
jgi:hypothetical protein